MKIGLIAAAFAVCATAASAQTLTVTGDDGATYTVIELSAGTGGNKEITTRRADAAGSVYSKHDVSCDPYRAGLMGSGATLDAMNDGLDSDPAMEEIIRFSAEDVIAGYACEN